MKNAILGFLVGAAVMYWSGQHGEATVQAVAAWFWGAAGNYNGSSELSDPSR
jgi:hypothetical protein